MKNNINGKIKVMLSITICMLLIVTTFSGCVIGFTDKIEQIDKQVVDFNTLPSQKTQTDRSSVDINPTDDAHIMEGDPNRNSGDSWTLINCPQFVRSYYYFYLFKFIIN